ncbi:MAG TPA: nucleoside-triphosphatase [Patescibacteria group bacterium]|nr:nucleoside-triphosphatase [Patescibacteria group bacterium]
MNARVPITNILVTGPPGCGKSTLILRVLRRITLPAGGFTTAEIRDPGGSRTGFRITDLSGAGGVLAHVSFGTGPRVGRYRVNLDDLERIGAAGIEHAIDDTSTVLIVVDEIARMELFSERFKRAVSRALDSPKPLLGTIQMRRDPFLDRVRSRPDTTIIHMERGGLTDAEEHIVSALPSLLE